jgi:hypothetical protein
MVNTLKIEDMLEGETNFQAWKERILLLLEENDLKEYVEVVVASPTDPQELVVHKKKEVKAKRVLLESIKDHLIPHISEKKYAKEMYDALVSLYQNKNTGRLLHLKHQLQVVRMSSEDTVVNYLMKITQIRDQLAAIGETIQDVELVNVALRGLPKSWEPFVQGICARETVPGFDRLWTDCIQEETQLESRDGLKSSHDENLSLSSPGKEGKVQEDFQWRVYHSRWKEEEGHEKIQVLCMSQVWTLCREMSTQEEGGKQNTTRGSCIDKGSSG